MRRTLWILGRAGSGGERGARAGMARRVRVLRRTKRATATTFGHGFNHCRLMFSSDHREKRGWSTDYPGADFNLSVRLSELTKTRVTRDKSGDPDYITVSAGDPDLFQCPTSWWKTAAPRASGTTRC
jgi:hypothetical protein